MKLKWKLPKDYMKLVYWIEGFGDAWKVHSGYIFAEYTYEEINEQRYVVSCDSLTSCVVRHIPSYFYTAMEAYALIQQKVEEFNATH